MSNNQDWKKSMPFLESSQGVKHDVMGTSITFYPISAGKIFKLKSLASPIGKLIESLQKNNFSTSSKVSRMAATETDGPIETIENNAIDPKLESQQSLRRQYAIEEVIKALTDDANITAFGELLIDSMKEVFPRGDSSNPKGDEFINSLPLPALGEMVIGVIDANKEVFGPLGGKIKNAIKVKMTQTLDEPPNDEPSDPEEESLGDQSRTEPSGSQTLGSTSPTLSNGSQPEATPSAG